MYEQFGFLLVIILRKNKSIVDFYKEIFLKNIIDFFSVEFLIFNFQIDCLFNKLFGVNFE